MATRLSAVLPSDDGASETERAKWVWQLAVLERSVTIRALGYLKAAQAGGKWDETVAALGDTGRFTVPWMAAACAVKQAASAAAEAAAAAGSGFEIIPALGGDEPCDARAVPELAVVFFDGRLHAGRRAAHHGLVRRDAGVRRQRQAETEAAAACGGQLISS